MIEKSWQLAKDKAMGWVHAVLQYDELRLDCDGAKCWVAAGSYICNSHLVRLTLLATILNRIGNKRHVENRIIDNVQREYIDVFHI
jgi:hypothetical protein